MNGISSINHIFPVGEYLPDIYQAEEAKEGLPYPGAYSGYFGGGIGSININTLHARGANDSLHFASLVMHDYQKSLQKNR